MVHWTVGKTLLSISSSGSSYLPVQPDVTFRLKSETWKHTQARKHVCRLAGCCPACMCRNSTDSVAPENCWWSPGQLFQVFMDKNLIMQVTLNTVFFIVTWPKAAIKHRLWFISQFSMFLSVYKFILHKRFDITRWRQVYPGLSGWEQYGSKTDSTPNLHQMQVLAVTHAPRVCSISHEASLHLSYATCGTEYSSTGAECLTLRRIQGNR